MAGECEVCWRGICADRRCYTGQGELLNQGAAHEALCHRGESSDCYRLGYERTRTALAAAEGRVASLRGALVALRARVPRTGIPTELAERIDAALNPTPATEPRTP